MSNPASSYLQTLYDKGKEYIEVNKDLIKLKVVDKLSLAASIVAIAICFVFIFFTMVVILNIGLALLIGDLLGKAYLGFFVLSLVYIIIGVILFVKRGAIFKRPLVKLFIKLLLSDS